MQSLGMITLAVAVVGLSLGVLVLVAPARARRAFTAFPRHVLAGRVLSALALAWAARMLHVMPMGMLDVYKPALLVLTPLLIGLTWYYLDELLAPRALGGLLLLIPAPWLTAARLHPSPWSAVASVVAYVMMVKGILLVTSPYQFRRQAEWWLGRDSRARVAGIVAIVLHGLLAVLALTVYA